MGDQFVCSQKINADAQSIWAQLDCLKMKSKIVGMTFDGPQTLVRFPSHMHKNHNTPLDHAPTAMGGATISTLKAI